MYTANTMASAAEAMGMSLPYSASWPAESPEKRAECVTAGKAIRVLLEKDIKPQDIMTAKAFENAITLTIVLGGSTNAVLHLRSEEHTSELQSLMRISYAVFCLKKKKERAHITT